MGLWDTVQKKTGTTAPSTTGGLWSGVKDSKGKPLAPAPQPNEGINLSPKLSTAFAQSTKAVADEGTLEITPITAAKFIGEAVIKYPVQAALKAALTLSPPSVRERIGTITAEDIGKIGPVDIGKIVAGEEGIRSLVEETPEAINALRQGGYGRLAPLIGFLGTTGAVALDLIPFGSLQKGLSLKLAEELTEDGVKTILRGELPKLTSQLEKSPDVWEPIVKALAKEKSPTVITDLLKSTEKSLLQTTEKPGTGIFGKEFSAPQLPAEEVPIYQGETDLTTKLLEKLKGRATVSKQFISDLTNSPDLRQVERNLVRDSLIDFGDEVNINDLAARVRQELLPLKIANYADRAKYEGIRLPDDLRGQIKNYDEHIYESPIETSAGKVHYQDYGAERGAVPFTPQKYFAHTRVEDMADNEIRRVIEIQSDLFQKGRLEREGGSEFAESYLSDADSLMLSKTNKRIQDLENAVNKSQYGDELEGLKDLREKLEGKANSEMKAGQAVRAEELTKLEPYRNTWWERIIKEETKNAAQDGKLTVQIPVGKTAMKIEGLGDTADWKIVTDKGSSGRDLRIEDISLGKEVSQYHNFWVITKTLGDGKFKAIPKRDYLELVKNAKDLPTNKDSRYWDEINRRTSLDGENFDISKDIDTNNPIYKFYEKDIGKFLQNKYGAKLVTDDQGVKWWEYSVNPKIADAPVEAFGGAAGLEYDENGKLQFNPKKAALGILGMSLAKKGGEEFSSIKNTVKGAYETATTKIIGNETEAVDAFKSFDSYNQILDEDRYIRVQEIQQLRDELAYTLSQNPARELSKYANRWGELAEVGGDGKGGKFARSGDSIVTELGYADSETAREAYTKYLNKKGELDALEQSLKEERPFLRERSALLRLLNKGKIKATPDLPEFGELVKDNIKIKDISGFRAGAQDMYRNFKDVFGEHFEQIKKMVLDPFDASKGQYIDEQTRLISELKANVTDKFGFKKGSKESRAIMDLGEGKIVADDVMRSFGAVKGPRIIEATDWFRGMYDNLLEEVNKVRKEIYPTRPDKIIPKRADYFRHYYEMTDSFGSLKNIFETPAGISPSLAGVSDFTQPKSKFLSFAQTRLGIKTERDAIGGFLNYIPSFAYAKHVDPQISVFKALRKDIIKGLEQSEDPKRLNNFLEYLHDFSNDLAGKTNPADRAIQKYIPGGRTTFRLIDWLNKRVKANTILGNVSSAVAQAFNIPQGVASAKQFSIPGATRTMAGLFQKNMPMSSSIFIKERYFKAFNEFDKSILDNTKKFAVWITGVLDEVGTKFIWNSHYEKAIAQGIENPIQFADDATRSLVAGRGIGEVPLLQKSKVFQIIAPFQLEVGNIWWVMKDMVNKKDMSGLATLFIANYLMNRVAEQVRGSDVTFDPIQAFIEGYHTLQDEENVGTGILKAGGRVVGEVLSNIPLGQTLASWVPENASKVGTITIPARKDLFGKGDPTRFGTGLLAFKGLQDPLFKVLPSFAGGQIDKTITGLRAWFKGAVEDKSGKDMYSVARSLPNLLRMGFFGAYSTPEARAYFNRAESPEAKIIRQEKQKVQQASDTVRDDAENTWKTLKGMPKEEAAQVFDQLIKDHPEIAKKIEKISKDEKLGLTYEDRQLLSASIPARAASIARLLDRQETKEAKAALWTELVNKKIITKDTAKALEAILQTDKRGDSAQVKEEVKFDTGGSESQGNTISLSDFQDVAIDFLLQNPIGMVKNLITDVVIPKINGRENQWSKNVADYVLDNFPFEQMAKDQFYDVNYKQFDFKGGVKGEYLLRGKEIFNISRKVLSEEASLWFYEKGQKFDPPTIRIEKDLEQPVAELMSHEMLHHLFMSLKNDPSDNEFAYEWYNAWDEVSDKYPELQAIDAHIKNNYKNPTPFGLANERYSYLGQKALTQGINAIPPELRRFYKDVVKGANQ